MLQLVRIHNNNPILGEPTCSKNWCKLCEMSWLRQNGFDGRSSIICLPTPRDPDRDPLRAHSSPCATVPYHVPVSSLCHLRHCAVCLCATMRLFCVPLCHTRHCAVCHCAVCICQCATVPFACLALLCLYSVPIWDDKGRSSFNWDLLKLNWIWVDSGNFCIELLLLCLFVHSWVTLMM